MSIVKSYSFPEGDIRGDMLVPEILLLLIAI